MSENEMVKIKKLIEDATILLAATTLIDHEFNPKFVRARKKYLRGATAWLNSRGASK